MALLLHVWRRQWLPALDGSICLTHRGCPHVLCLSHHPLCAESLWICPVCLWWSAWFSLKYWDLISTVASAGLVWVCGGHLCCRLNIDAVSKDGYSLTGPPAITNKRMGVGVVVGGIKPLCDTTGDTGLDWTGITILSSTPSFQPFSLFDFNKNCPCSLFCLSNHLKNTIKLHNSRSSRTWIQDIIIWSFWLNIFQSFDRCFIFLLCIQIWTKKFLKTSMIEDSSFGFQGKTQFLEF